MSEPKTIETLRLIIGRAPSVSGEAARTIRAIAAESPIVQQRLNFVAEGALNDPESRFSENERTRIAALMDIQADSEPTILSIRLTRAERADVQRLAELEGYSDTTSYVRAKLGLF